MGISSLYLIVPMPILRDQTVTFFFIVPFKERDGTPGALKHLDVIFPTHLHRVPHRTIDPRVHSHVCVWRSKCNVIYTQPYLPRWLADVCQPIDFVLG